MNTILRRFAFCMWLALPIAAHSPLTARAADPPVAQSLPLTTWDSRIMLPVRVNGRGPFWFIMDTGDPGRVALTPETARAIHLRTSAGAQQSGAGERTVSSLQGTIQTLTVGSLQFHAQPVDVIDLSQIRKNLKFPHLDGVLGYSILQGLSVLVDQDRRTVTLSPAELAHPKTAHLVPFSLQNNFIHVPALIDATSGTIVLDTGDRSSFTIFGRFAQEHHFYGKYPGPRNVLTGFGIGGPVYGDVFKLPNIEVFGFHLQGVVTRASRQHAGVFASSPEAGSAGGNLLRRFNIIYDYPHHELVVWPSSRFNKADVYVPLEPAS